MSQIYDPVSGTYVDDGGGANGGSLASGDDNSDSLWSGLGGFLGTIGTTIATDFRAISGPATVRPGSYVYNPNTGAVTQAGGLSLGSGNSSSLLLLLGFGLVVLLLLRR